MYVRTQLTSVRMKGILVVVGESVVGESSYRTPAHIRIPVVHAWCLLFNNSLASRRLELLCVNPAGVWVTCPTLGAVLQHLLPVLPCHAGACFGDIYNYTASLKGKASLSRCICI